jgi:hypothetical protein
MSRRKDRRQRITKAIRFYLSVYRYGEWTSNVDIILHLESSARGSKSINSISRETLGNYMRAIVDSERREVWIDGKRQTQYRILPEEEE